MTWGARAMPMLLLLALAGCPPSGPRDPAHAPAAPKSCERMADHVIGLMQVKDPRTGNPVEHHRETADAITRVLIETCTNDKWTPDAQNCWLELASFREVDRCAPLMTVEQRERFGSAMESAVPPKAEPSAPAGAPGSPSS